MTALIVMGVSGSGKTSVAKALSDRLGWSYAEGDDMHPAANVEKMHAGHPLDDADRWPWLRRIGDYLDEEARSGAGCIVTCSALKRSYRDLLCGGRAQVRFVYLEGSRAVIAERLADRTGHFMPAALLDSQLADLEPLRPDEPGRAFDIAPGSPAVVEAVLSWLPAA